MSYLTDYLTKQPPAFRQSGLPFRRLRLPARYHDELPAEPSTFSAPIQPVPNTAPLPSSDLAGASQDDSEPTEFLTLPDSFGLYRKYPGGRPQHVPNESDLVIRVSDAPGISIPPSPVSQRQASPEPSPELFAPFSNISTFRLISWFYGKSNTKSRGELQSLVDDVINQPDFSPSDLMGFCASWELNRMIKHISHTQDPHPMPSINDDWLSSSIYLSLPCQGVKHVSEDAAPKLEIKGLRHRHLLDVIKAALREPAAEMFHLFPFRSYWKSSSDEPAQRVYSEAYTADHFLGLYEEVRTKPQDTHVTPVVIGLMVWSDSTHMTSFGTASLWPIYIYFGNQSKYSRAKPSSFAAHHLAYIPKVRFHLCSNSG